MSNYQQYNSKEQSGEFGDYLHEHCSACGGRGWEYVDGIPYHQIPCSTCKGTGRGKPNSSKLSKFILVGLFLIGLGYLICKLLNI